VAELLSDPERPVVEVFEMMLQTNHLGSQPHPVVAAIAREMLNKEDREPPGRAGAKQSTVSGSASESITLDTGRAALHAHCNFLGEAS